MTSPNPKSVLFAIIIALVLAEPASAFASYPRSENIKIVRTGDVDRSFDSEYAQATLLERIEEARTLDEASSNLSGEDQETVHLGMSKIVRLAKEWQEKWQAVEASKELQETLTQDLEDWAGYISEAQAIIDKVAEAE